MAAALVPCSLRTEYTENPIGIDELRPRLSWRLRATGPAGEGGQAAYQVLVGLDRDEARAGQGDCWDSGRVESAATGQVEFGGAGLRSTTEYFWAVRIWDSAGEASGWSEPATFETGLLSPDDWGGAAWIGRGAAAEVAGVDGLAAAVADASPAADAAGGAAGGSRPAVDASGLGSDASGAGSDASGPAGEGGAPAPLLRKAFRLSGGQHGGIRRARLYVCGLGFGEYHLDGQRVGRAVLDPAPTNYDATVLYSTYDVTAILQAASPDADHVVAAALGRGRYGEPTPSVWYWEQAPWWDDPKLLAQLVVSYADGHTEKLVSDGSWRTIDGPTRSDSLYAGERFDARLEPAGWTSAGFDESAWSEAGIAAAPRGVLRSQQQEPIEAVGEIAPVTLTEPLPGVFVFDLGQQIAGWARLRLSGPAGREVRITYGERLHDDGSVDMSQQLRLIEADIQTDTYVLAGDGVETYEPRFSYKGFQYVQIEGYPGRPELGDLCGVVVHTAVASTGEFQCDDELVNRLHTATRWAVLNNLHGVPTDTPVFEKNGWTGDAHLTADVAAYNFHMPRFYTKWLQDWVDAQKPTGEFPPIIPTSGWGYHDDAKAAIVGPIPAWDVAYVEIPWVMYRHYGDVRILERHYDGARRYLDWLVDGFLRDDIMLVGLGDWLPPGGPGMPPEGPGVYETAYTYRFAQLLAEMAKVVGRAEDVDHYVALMRRIAAGFNQAFFDQEAATYHGERPSGYRQAANAVALTFGLVPDDAYTRVLANLVADIHDRQDHLDTGVIGTKFLLPLLSGNGLVDLAFTVATQRTYPGYGHWMELGATALYEHWHADSRSRNHHFFGHVDQWFVEHLAGLSPAEAGFAKVLVRPCPPKALGWARAAVDSVRGRVATEWERRGEGFAVQVEVPPGVSAEVHVPQPDGGYEVRNVGSGVHTLTS